MGYKLLLLILILSLDFLSFSQYPISSEFAAALDKKTRTLEGLPGQNYFVNKADYKIIADFDPYTGQIDGNEIVVYYNQSPDTLKEIVIRLYYNILKSGNPHDSYLDSRDFHNGIEIKSLEINQKKIDLRLCRFQGTIMVVPLKDYLFPKSSMQIKISWQSIVPQYNNIRTGKYPNNNYLVAYWYPQIAVYDDIFGWDKNSYTGTQEFYNDHNNFNVKINAPEPFIVWATGRLYNATDVFTEKVLLKFKKAYLSDSVVKIISPTDYSSKILKNSQNTFHFIAENVTDFVFAVSKDHHWDAVSISIPDKTERVLINAVYADSSELFHQTAWATRKILSYFSFNLPQIFYPFPTLTIFQGQGGMEYPMFVNLGHTDKKESFYYVLAHEIAHNYLPFYCTTNETVFAWMDEGFINFFPRLVVDELFNLNRTFDIFTEYEKNARTFFDLPINTPANIYKDFWKYRIIAYNKPSYALMLLKDYLSDTTFWTIFREYINTWKYKHPTPYDFIFFVENYLKQDLSWFFKPFFFQISYPLLEIVDIKNEQELSFKIINTGGIPQPINLKIIFEDNSSMIYIYKKWMFGKIKMLILFCYLSAKKLKVLNSCTQQFQKIEKISYGIDPG